MTGGVSSPSGANRNGSKCAAAVAALRSEIRAGKFTPSRPFPSITGVSRRFGISRATAVKVFDRLKADGLVRSRSGSGTFVSADAKPRLVGLMVPGISYSSEFFQAVVGELIRVAHAADCALLMDGAWSPDAGRNGREVVEVAARFIRRKVSGVIYQPLEHSETSETVNRRALAAFARARIPVVLLDGDVVASPARSRHDLVSIDNVGFGERLAAHLFGCGAKEIRFLLRENWVYNVADRVRGVRNAVLARGRPWRPANVVKADPTDADAIRRVMARRPRPDAFVCENDVLAASLLKTLAGLGWRVPEDVRLAGFDDVQVARLSSPSLTSVRQPCAEIAQLAFDRLLARIADPGLRPLHLVPSAELVVRESTAGEKAGRGI